MGSGKTVVGGLIAQRSGAAFRDLDLMVEDQAGMAVSDIFAIHSEGVFRAIESSLLPKALQPDTVVALGGGATVAASTWKAIKELAPTVYPEASFEPIWARTGHQPNRPLFFGHLPAECQPLCT